MAAEDTTSFFLVGQNKTKKKKRSAESAKVRAVVNGKVKSLHGLKLWSSERPLDSKTFCQRRDRNDDDDYDVTMKSRCASLPAPVQQGFLHKL